MSVRNPHTPSENYLGDSELRQRLIVKAWTMMIRQYSISTERAVLFPSGPNNRFSVIRNACEIKYKILNSLPSRDAQNFGDINFRLCMKKWIKVIRNNPHIITANIVKVGKMNQENCLFRTQAVTKCFLYLLSHLWFYGLNFRSFLSDLTSENRIHTGLELGECGGWFNIMILCLAKTYSTVRCSGEKVVVLVTSLFTNQDVLFWFEKY